MTDVNYQQETAGNNTQEQPAITASNSGSISLRSRLTTENEGAPEGAPYPL